MKLTGLRHRLPTETLRLLKYSIQRLKFKVSMVCAVDIDQLQIGTSRRFMGSYKTHLIARSVKGLARGLALCKTTDCFFESPHAALGTTLQIARRH